MDLPVAGDLFSFYSPKIIFWRRKTGQKKTKKPQKCGHCAIDLQGVPSELRAKWQRAWVVKYLGG
jgi:hypothetical protein